MSRSWLWSVGLAAALAGGCGTPERAEHGPGHAAEASSSEGHGGSHADAGLAAGEPTSHSLYNLPSEWRDQRGEARALGSLAGRIQVVSMVYTHCGHACPRILMDMKRIEGLVGEGADVGFVLVSLDPERDTPERLARYAESVDLDPEKWTLLTAPDQDVLELAALLGVRYRSTGDGELEHSNVITVLDAEGEVAHRQLGLGQDASGTVRAIRTLLE